MKLHYSGMPSALAQSYRSGAPDAYGLAPERAVLASGHLPCRHCLGEVQAGEAYLTLAYRPFAELQPYAETGPVFIHAEACPAYDPAGGMPARVARSTGQSIVRGYGRDDRIVYGTGVVVDAGAIAAAAEAALAREDVVYVHLRSATNNCFTLRIDAA